MRAVYLHELLEKAVPHESAPAPVDPQLRRSAWAALGIDASYLIVILISGHVARVERRPGFFILGWPLVRWALSFGEHPGAGAIVLLLLIVAAVSLSIFTNGFSDAPLWGHWAIFGLDVTALLASLDLFAVVLVAVVNVVLWVFFIALIIGLCLLAVGVLFAMLAA